MLLFAAFVTLATAAELPKGVIDCGKYVGTGRECVDKGDGCMGEGWFSKDNKATLNGMTQRVDAVAVCKGQGYTGASNVNYGGNYGHQCRFPGTSGKPNKAGGSLTSFGYTVTWQCVGAVEDSTNTPTVAVTPKPTTATFKFYVGTEAENVVDCGAYATMGAKRECHNKGSGCKGEGWLSKDNDKGENRVNASVWCQKAGFTGADTTMYGGNWGDQCRHPGSSLNNFNKAGGALTSFGYTVTWKCTGSRGDSSAPVIAPTPEPTRSADWSDEDWPKLPADVVDCGNYNTDHPEISKDEDRECFGEGVGCVGDHWYSKDTTKGETERVDAEQICKDQGYQGVGDEWGGNWGDICRYPGSQQGIPNKHGGDINEFGLTVTWECQLPRLQQGVTASPTIMVTSAPTTKADVSDLPVNVVSCAKYVDEQGEKSECQKQGLGCVTEDWFSKDNTAEPNKRVNAQQVCTDNGYSGVAEFGGNWGHQCRFPGAAKGVTNKAGGKITEFGYTVTWRCERGVAPTFQPTAIGRVTDCGTYNGEACKGKGVGCAKDGWYSKIADPNIDADEFCLEKGFKGADPNMYGGNWGHVCRFPGNLLTAPNKAGGSLKNLGRTVTWRCLDQKETSSPTVAVTNAPSLPPTEPKSVIVDCGKYEELGEKRECVGKQMGCVGDGWFSKDNTTPGANQRVDAQQICKDNGYDKVGTQYGGNWGHICRYPGESPDTPNKAGGSLTSFGYTVTWQCVKEGDKDACNEAETEDVCDVLKTCMWQKKKCVDAPEYVCDEAGEVSKATAVADCKKLSGDSTACGALGCKYKKAKGKKAAKCSMKKPKCKKVSLDACCRYEGCNYVEGDKKCGGKFAGW